MKEKQKATINVWRKEYFRNYRDRKTGWTKTRESITNYNGQCRNEIQLGKYLDEVGSGWKYGRGSLGRRTTVATGKDRNNTSGSW